MKWVLTTLCIVVIICMSLITISASMDRSILQAGRGLWPDLWFCATLMDAYFAFLTFFGWVAYKETNWSSRIAWFIAIMLLGNFAMAAYLLRQLSKIERFTWPELLLRPDPAS